MCQGPSTPHVGDKLIPPFIGSLIMGPTIGLLSLSPGSLDPSTYIAEYSKMVVHQRTKHGEPLVTSYVPFMIL